MRSNREMVNSIRWPDLARSLQIADNSSVWEGWGVGCGLWVKFVDNI